jgi:hypothetical protein
MPSAPGPSQTRTAARKRPAPTADLKKLVARPPQILAGRVIAVAEYAQIVALKSAAAPPARWSIARSYRPFGPPRGTGDFLPCASTDT